MMAGGNGVGGIVVRSRYGSPKLKMSSTQPSGVMSCWLSEGYVASWIQKHFTVSARTWFGLYSWYFTSQLSETDLIAGQPQRERRLRVARERCRRTLRVLCGLLRRHQLP